MIVDWITAGTHWQNGSHSLAATLTFASPGEKRHLLWREIIGIYRFHESVTEPANLPLTQIQRRPKYIDRTMIFGMNLPFLMGRARADPHGAIFLWMQVQVAGLCSQIGCDPDPMFAIGCLSAVILLTQLLK